MRTCVHYSQIDGLVVRFKQVFILMIPCTGTAATTHGSPMEFSLKFLSEASCLLLEKEQVIKGIVTPDILRPAVYLRLTEPLGVECDSLNRPLQWKKAQWRGARVMCL